MHNRKPRTNTMLEIVIDNYVSVQISQSEREKEVCCIFFAAYRYLPRWSDYQWGLACITGVLT